MRAITPVFSVLLIIVLSVAMVGFLWLFFTGTFNSLTSTGTSTVGESLTTISSCMKIESVYGNQVSIRNCGKGVISQDTLKVYLDNVPLDIFGLGNYYFGKTTIGPYEPMQHDPDYKFATGFQATENGVINQISLYAYAESGSPAVAKFFVYSDNGGKPDTLLGITGEVLIPDDDTYAWRSGSLNVNIEANKYYWIGAIVGNNPIQRQFDNGGLTYFNANPYSNGASSSWGLLSSESLTYSIYATYTTVATGDRTFGETNILASIDHIYPGEMEGIKASLVETGLVTGMSIYIKAISGTANCKLSIYSDNSGAPQTLLGVTNEVSGIDTSWGWRSFSFSSPFSLNPGDYWLMPMCNNDVNTEYDTSSPGYDLFGGTYPNFPNPWSDGSSYPFRESIYATYTTSGVINEGETGTVTLSGLWNFNPGGHLLRVTNPKVITEREVEAVLSEQSPVLDLEFDEDSGNIAYDSSGNGNNGNLVNGPIWVDGEFGKALQFDGIDDFVNITNDFENVFNSFTIDFWVYPTATHEIDTESNSGYDGVSGQKYAIFPTNANDLGLDNNHACVGLSIGTNGVSVYEHAADYMPALLVWEGTLNGWTHITLVYDDRVPKLYINGNLVRTGLTSTKSYVHPSPNNYFEDGIGGGYWGYFNGAIDSLKIYDKALIPGETGGISLKLVSYD